jgi:hypothetical protein
MKAVRDKHNIQRMPVSWDQFDQLKAVALKGAADLFSFFAQNPTPEIVAKPQAAKGESLSQKNHTAHNNQNKAQKSSMFTLANRLQATQSE